MTDSGFPFSLRKAKPEDQYAIRDLIRRSHVNPMALAWPRFIVADDEHGTLLGCGQIKTHIDGSRELASIAVEESRRKQGIASAIIAQLLTETTMPVFLTCREKLGSFYENFGFKIADWAQMTPYFRILRILTGIFQSLHILPGKILVMIKSS
ncbi:MAG: GNAT family N-acetyltransferase [Bacteroidales bacterium]|nr:GNAT family N-acetyltransferase [Bacteroidales bacterium]